MAGDGRTHHLVVLIEPQKATWFGVATTHRSEPARPAQPGSARTGEFKQHVIRYIAARAQPLDAQRGMCNRNHSFTEQSNCATRGRYASSVANGEVDSFGRQVDNAIFSNQAQVDFRVGRLKATEPWQQPKRLRRLTWQIL